MSPLGFFFIVFESVFGALRIPVGFSYCVLFPRNLVREKRSPSTEGSLWVFWHHFYAREHALKSQKLLSKVDPRLHLQKTEELIFCLRFVK